MSDYEVSAHCMNCRFWIRQNAFSGECHRHAPAPKLDRPGQYPRNVWPETEGGSFCGDFAVDPRATP